MLRRVASPSMRTAAALRATRNECGVECAGQIGLDTKGFEPDHLDMDQTVEAAVGLAFPVFGSGSGAPHAVPEALLAKPLWDAARPLSVSYPGQDVNDIAPIAAR
jgi:hypothetical protein